MAGQVGTCRVSVPPRRGPSARLRPGRRTVGPSGCPRVRGPHLAAVFARRGRGPHRPRPRYRKGVVKGKWWRYDRALVMTETTRLRAKVAIVVLLVVLIVLLAPLECH